MIGHLLYSWDVFDLKRFHDCRTRWVRLMIKNYLNYLESGFSHTDYSLIVKHVQIIASSLFWPSSLLVYPVASIIALWSRRWATYSSSVFMLVEVTVLVISKVALVLFLIKFQLN